MAQGTWNSAGVAECTKANNIQLEAEQPKLRALAALYTDNAGQEDDDLVAPHSCGHVHGWLTAPAATCDAAGRHGNGVKDEGWEDKPLTVQQPGPLQCCRSRLVAGRLKYVG